MVTYIFLCAVKVRVGKSCVDFDTDVLLFPEGGKTAHWDTEVNFMVLPLTFTEGNKKAIGNTIVPLLNIEFAK